MTIKYNYHKNRKVNQLTDLLTRREYEWAEIRLIRGLRCRAERLTYTTQHFLESQNDSNLLFSIILSLVEALQTLNILRTMNFDRTDIVFVVEKSVSMKTYLPELLESYVTPIIS